MLNTQALELTSRLRCIYDVINAALLAPKVVVFGFVDASSHFQIAALPILQKMSEDSAKIRHPLIRGLRALSLRAPLKSAPKRKAEVRLEWGIVALRNGALFSSLRGLMGMHWGRFFRGSSYFSLSNLQVITGMQMDGRLRSQAFDELYYQNQSH